MLGVDPFILTVEQPSNKSNCKVDMIPNDYQTPWWFKCAAGRDLLVHPVTEEGATGVTAYLPGKDEVRGPSYCLLGVE